MQVNSKKNRPKTYIFDNKKCLEYLRFQVCSILANRLMNLSDQTLSYELPT